MLLRAVKMTIRDTSGQIRLSIDASPGLPTMRISKLLTPGRIRVTFETTVAARFQLRGTRIRPNWRDLQFANLRSAVPTEPNDSIVRLPFAPTIPILFLTHSIRFRDRQ